MKTKREHRLESDWKVLEDCLRYEKETLQKCLKQSHKEKDYFRCVELDEEFFTITWILEEMEHIKETGECL